MKYQEQREAFKELTIRQGICRLEQLPEAMPFGCDVPERLVQKWLNRILELPTSFSTQRRYVNRFKLGADPEFIFSRAGERCDAKHLELQQGLAFGMDNNGRLVELRPYPSRSAVEVVASILATMRWLALLVPKSMQYDWCSGAFLCGDGLGGHVHLGRKRPGRAIEVKALDTIEGEMEVLGAYPIREIARRRGGDEHRQLYGLLGDIRKQRHGYEYRTFPSWLDSPELAFLTITLSKLAVQNPRLTQGYVPLLVVSRHFQRIRNLLAYYKDTDDDARLALQMISRHFPVHVGGDFKKRWGIEPIVSARPDIRFIPSSIKPNAEDVQEMFDHLGGSKLLKQRLPVATWGPLVPPEGYKMVITELNTVQAKGLGELFWDVCQHQSFHYPITNAKEGRIFFQIPATLAAKLPIGWQRFCKGKIIVQHNDGYIYSHEKARDVVTFDECRRLLLETVFPFWRIKDVKPDSWQQWQSQLRKKPEKGVWAGQLLYGDQKALPYKDMMQ